MREVSCWLVDILGEKKKWAGFWWIVQSINKSIRGGTWIQTDRLTTYKLVSQAIQGFCRGDNTFLPAHTLHKQTHIPFSPRGGWWISPGEVWRPTYSTRPLGPHFLASVLLWPSPLSEILDCQPVLNSMFVSLKLTRYGSAEHTATPDWLTVKDKGHAFVKTSTWGIAEYHNML